MRGFSVAMQNRRSDDCQVGMHLHERFLVEKESSASIWPHEQKIMSVIILICS